MVMLFLGTCRRVLTRSRGWNKMVEQVPEMEPARNDFTMGDWWWRKEENNNY